MSVKTATTLLCNSVRACLLLVLFLSSYLSICSGSLTENETISRTDNTPYPETTTPQGAIRGINMVTRYNRTVSGFIGIPYAEPPVDDLRFKPPVPAGQWNETLDASSDSEPCPQFNDQNEIVGNEDCLYLNVYTPQLPATNDSTLLPVMVYIIGGAFKSGITSIDRFGPDFLLDEDIVLVIPSFRVGVLGYLSTGDEVSPGNYGLKDIVRALQWVQDSIRYFGGDPNHVTFFGGSSGAMSVHLLTLSNLTEGLFHKYITQSGTAFPSELNRPREVHTNQAIQLGEYFDCPTTTSTLLVNCLRGINASRFVDTESVFHVWASYPLNVWTPSPEPDIEGALLTDIPANLHAAGNIRDLPWIASVTKDEGLYTAITFYEDPDLFEDFLNNIDLALPQILGYYGTPVDVTAHTNALKSYYLNDLTANRSLLLVNLTQLVGDSSFVYPTYKAVQHQLASTKSIQYFCSFEYEGTFSHTYLASGGSTQYSTVTHGDEMHYLFKDKNGRFGPADYEYSDNDLVMVDTMVQLWTSFAINGTPTTLDSLNTVIWEPYSSLNNYIQIGNGSGTALEMKYDLYKERMQFWDDLTRVATASRGFRNPLDVLLIALCLCAFSYIG